MYDSDIQKNLTERSNQFLDQIEKNELTEERETAELLRELIRFHDWRYYVQNDPLISDYEYDQLFEALQSLEEDHPNWTTADSPTQRVSTDQVEGFPSVRHLVLMLSLNNSYDAEDLKDFDERLHKLTDIPMEQDIEYVVEPKFDGGSIALIYEDDQYVRAATRGNGEVGDDITENIRTLRSVPLKADFSSHGIYKAELRGEALIRKDRFEQVNKRREEHGESIFANPRNAATGGLRMKDPSATAKRGVEVFIYHLDYAEDAEGTDITKTLESHMQGVDLLTRLGFKVDIEDIKLCSNIDESIDACIEWEERREDYPYEIDGTVVKANSLDLQEKAGSTAHHPRWAIAYKFKAKQATTKLIKVEFQVGKIGSITPVGKVKPVSLAGVTISSVTLHNEDFIKSKDIRIGDTVVVERAGDVIPYIVKSLTDLRDGKEEEIVFPSTCPCPVHSELKRLETEAAWRCIHPDCPRQLVQRMIHHVSTDAMDIDGMGVSYIERFREEGWLHQIPDIYKLDYKQIATLDGFGEKSAENLKKSIEEAKTRPIKRLLYSLSIHHLGKKASGILAERIDHVLDLKNWTFDDYIEIKDIGPVLAENMVTFFSDVENIEMIRELERLGVNMEQTEEDRPVDVAEDAPLKGKTILFTGSLETMTRKEAKSLAEKLGAKNRSSVSGNLDILVVGESPGSKLDKAKELGTVEIWSEEEFLNKYQV